MAQLSITALLIRFLLGGFAVLASTLIARKVGERAGGIFAAFPAVYLASLLSASIDMQGEHLVTQSILLSKGAIIGMGINILIAVLAGYLLPKQGWKRGLVNVVGCWFMISMVVVIFASH